MFLVVLMRILAAYSNVSSLYDLSSETTFFLNCSYELMLAYIVIKFTSNPFGSKWNLSGFSILNFRPLYVASSLRQKLRA